MRTVESNAVDQPSQQHRTIADVARRWQVNPATAKKKLANEPGVLRFTSGSRVCLRVPDSVIENFERKISVGS